MRKTIVEQLDEAKDGEEFLAAMLGLFNTLDKARDDE